MNEWKITTPQAGLDGYSRAAVTVRAHKAAATPAGVLLLSERSGEMVRAFAPGAWLECELTKQGQHGYS